jgi:hypothetical protein
MSTKTKTQLHKHLKEMLKEFELAYYIGSSCLTEYEINDLKEVITNIISSTNTN